MLRFGETAPGERAFGATARTSGEAFESAFVPEPPLGRGGEDGAPAVE